MEHLKNGKYRKDNSLIIWGILVKIKKVYNFIFAISACVFRFLPRWDGANTPSRQSDRREINFLFFHYATTCFSRMEGINPDRLRSTGTKRGLRGVGRFDTYQIILLSINSACGPPARILRFFDSCWGPSRERRTMNASIIRSAFREVREHGHSFCSLLNLCKRRVSYFFKNLFKRPNSRFQLEKCDRKKLAATHHIVLIVLRETGPFSIQLK